MERVSLHLGDSAEVLRGLPEDSIDAVVCDPPYGLSKEPDMAEALRHWLAGDDYKHSGGGFMGKAWDSFVPGPALWREVFRVLKPGGHLLAFAGSRTYDLMAVAIRLAGFEVRDQIMWLYGSGFPKSLDVSKAIDKAAGSEDAARQWQGWGTALKPAHEPVVVARKPLQGTVAANVLKWGTGALNIDGCRIPSEKPTGWGGGAYGGDTWNKGNSRLCKGGEARPVDGRWPANVIHDGSEEVTARFPRAKGAVSNGRKGKAGIYEDGIGSAEQRSGYADDGSAARFFYCAKASRSERNAGLEHLPELTGGQATDRKDGSKGLDNPRAGAGRTGATRNFHPTVKPIALMRYLCRLVTPPGGTVLDPFMGSGSTGCAAVQEGFNFVGVEMDPEYLEIARARITHWNPEREPEPANDNTPNAEPDSGEEQLDLLAGIA